MELQYHGNNKKPLPNTVYTSCGFQSNLQVQSSLARAVMVDSEVATKTRTLHTLNVMGKAKKALPIGCARY